jgi:hypothetical protein
MTRIRNPRLTAEVAEVAEAIQPRKTRTKKPNPFTTEGTEEYEGTKVQNKPNLPLIYTDDTDPTRKPNPYR